MVTLSEFCIYVSHIKLLFSMVVVYLGLIPISLLLEVWDASGIIVLPEKQIATC